MAEPKRYPSGTRRALSNEEVLAEVARLIAALGETRAASPLPSPVPVVPRGPPNPGNIVGELFYVRVSSHRVLVEVIEDTRDPRRPYKLRRVDNGRVLSRLRSAAALHVTDKAAPFPPKKGD